jgi:hypothetical protein
MRLLALNPRLAKLWHGEKNDGDTTASGLDWSMAIALGKVGVAEQEIARVLSHYPHGQIGSGKLRGGQVARRLGQLLQAAAEAQAETRESATEPAPASQRVDIRLTPEHWNRMLAECASILRSVLYLRGTVPVMLARAVETSGKEIEDKDGAAVDLNGVRYRPGSLLFMEAVPGRVAWYLDEHVTFWRYVRREKEWVPQHCPKEVVPRPTVR